jgi:hypothetical protein
LEKTSHLPMLATVALEMIGPMPGTVISRTAPSSACASSVISVDTASMRSSSRRQSVAVLNEMHHARCQPIGHG